MNQTDIITTLANDLAGEIKGEDAKTTRAIILNYIEQAWERGRAEGRSAQPNSVAQEDEAKP